MIQHVHLALIYRGMINPIKPEIKVSHLQKNKVSTKHQHDINQRNQLNSLRMQCFSLKSPGQIQWKSGKGDSSDPFKHVANLALTVLLFFPTPPGWNTQCPQQNWITVNIYYRTEGGLPPLWIGKHVPAWCVDAVRSYRPLFHIPTDSLSLCLLVDSSLTKLSVFVCYSPVRMWKDVNGHQLLMKFM